MKKILSILTILLLAFSLVSCKGDPKPNLPNDKDKVEDTNGNNDDDEGSGLYDEVYG